MKKTKLLLVEDDELASELIYDFLTDCEFEVDNVFTATDAVSYINNRDYNIMILDINLPDYTGYEVLKNIKNSISLPIIVISGDNQTKSKILAFKYGASDYMVKPIDLEELEARIWVQLSNSSQIKTDNDKNIFEIKDSTILFKQNPLNLTHIEFNILSNLIKNKNQTISRETLLESISSISSNRALDNHIKNIRKKIDSKDRYITTEYGVGYKLSF